MLIEILAIPTAALHMSLFCLVVFSYFKIKKINYIKMNIDEIIDGIPDEIPDNNKKDRLSAIVAGGGSKQYLGRDLQLTDIDSMSNEEINKLYCRYEARLGASMTKTLGNSFINLYAMGVSRFFKVDDPPKLISELEEDPFINHALTSACCELYYRYGMYLAPLTAMLTTVKHIDFKNKKSDNINGGDETRGTETRGTSDTGGISDIQS